MVEANTELLGGAAVTVFLALLFFGVVVLWDVALALRSVGDKIDKLEDNIDDDLTDIAHHLDGMSNARGGGGGTQLHLSGGTISSGPGANQPQQAPQAGPQQGGTQQPTADQATPPGGVGPQPQPHPQQADQQSQAARRAAEPAEEATSSETNDAPEPPRSDEDLAETDESTADVHGPNETESDAESDTEPDSDDEPVEHPRAEHSRGRFITSPDRTAWYATPLDYEAIAAARPTIAGELTDGSDDGIDESDVIAVGPVGSSTTAETEEDDATAADVSDEEADGATDAMDVTDDGEITDDSTGDDDAMADARTTSDATSETTDNGDRKARESPDEDGDGDEDGAVGESDDTGKTDEGEADDELEALADELPDSSDDIDVLEFGEPSEDSDATTEGTEVAPTDDESTDTEGTDHAGVPDIADGSTEPVPADEESALEDDAASDSEATGTEDSDADDADTAAAADALSPFEFEESGFEADDEDVSVEDAVDTMNENAPVPELSSHRFDVTAEETGDGGAVVTLAFEPDTIEIAGSTKRLLQYQLQSFADRESTPAADVTISRDRIVIELPDSDGTAIQQWGEAAVSIVDRTLYLSDNSPDS
ncbi:AAA family ATPase [Natrinema zhouii]|uniref:AAA family ATPase n=1 Tax=Natrinema zhouii TaxID=1710539 RepID=A0A7D6H1W8_9EURY|nr:AAA family ATPase [Natrinema zhouii]QLK25267.1 AAA family ATPase [Natrinema zhouii]